MIGIGCCCQADMPLHRTHTARERRPPLQALSVVILDTVHILLLQLMTACPLGTPRMPNEAARGTLRYHMPPAPKCFSGLPSGTYNKIVRRRMSSRLDIPGRGYCPRHPCTCLHRTQNSSHHLVLSIQGCTGTEKRSHPTLNCQRI